MENLVEKNDSIGESNPHPSFAIRIFPNWRISAKK
jgi:hypothetical protein